MIGEIAINYLLITIDVHAVQAAQLDQAVAHHHIHAQPVHAAHHVTVIV